MKLRRLRENDKMVKNNQILLKKTKDFVIIIYIKILYTYQKEVGICPIL